MPINKDNFIVVYVIGATSSPEFAIYYAEKHNMDTTNSDPSTGNNNGTIGGINWQVDGQMVGIECDTDEVFATEELFNLNVLNPLKEALTTSDELSGRNIWGIVLGYRVPGGYNYVDEYTGEHTISATSRLSRIYHDFEPKLANRLYNRQVFKFYDADDADFALLCSRIDAPTFVQAKTFVDNADDLRRQLFVGGLFFIDPYSDVIGSSADTYKLSLENFRDFSLPKLNLDSFSTQFLDPYIDVTIPFVQDDSFVWSWNSSRASDDFFQFTSYPRAFFYNADINNGLTIRDPDGTTWPILSMRSGYVCCASAMSNPTIEGYLNPTAFFNAAFRLATMGEAYMYSLPFVDWTMTLFGDPLVHISFPQAVFEDTEKLDADQLWENTSKDTSRIAAQNWQKEQDLYNIVTDIVNSQITDVEVALLRPADQLYSMYSLSNRRSLLSAPVTSLFEYPIRTYTNAIGFTINSLEDYLNLTGYKVSELLLEINEEDVSSKNIYDEGWWEFKSIIQDEYFGFINYQFILEMYDNEEMTGLPVFSSDSVTVDGWSYESSLENYTNFPVGGITSSYIGRKVRYQSRKDDLISLDEYKARGQTYYFRIRQYDAIKGTLFPWASSTDIIWT